MLNTTYRRRMNCRERKIFKGLSNKKKDIWCSVPTLQEGGQGTEEFGCIDLKFVEFMGAAKLGGVTWCTMRGSGFGSGAVKRQPLFRGMT